MAKSLFPFNNAPRCGVSSTYSRFPVTRDVCWILFFERFRHDEVAASESENEFFGRFEDPFPNYLERLRLYFLKFVVVGSCECKKVLRGTMSHLV